MDIKLERNTFINNFFSYLLNKADYAILHHLDKIYDIDGDIDMIVNTSKKDIIEIIQFFCSENNASIVNIFTISKNIVKINIAFKVNDIWTTLQLDICTERGNNLLNINTKKLSKDKIKKEMNGCTFFKISDIDECKYYINKKAYKFALFDKTVNINDYSIYFDSLKCFSNSIINELFLKNIYYYQSFFFKIKNNLLKLQTLFFRFFEKKSLLLNLNIKNESILIDISKNHFFSDTFIVNNLSINFLIKNFFKPNLIIITGKKKMGFLNFFVNTLTIQIKNNELNNKELTNEILEKIVNKMEKK